MDVWLVKILPESMKAVMDLYVLSVCLAGKIRINELLNSACD